MSFVIVQFREAELKDHGIFFSCTWLLFLTLFKYFNWLNILTGYMYWMFYVPTSYKCGQKISVLILLSISELKHKVKTNRRDTEL